MLAELPRPATSAEHSLRSTLTALVLSLGLVAACIVSLTPSEAAAASPCTGNAIVCENQLPGTPQDIWDDPGAGDDSLQGFATTMSVNAGATVNFKITTDAQAYTIKIYRLGWYQGLGARLVDSFTPDASLARNQPACATNAATEIYDCGTWRVSASWPVPSSAVSGVYLAQLIRSDDNGSSQIPFVVRNDGSTSKVLFQTSDTTWQAYNAYGGSNFYSGKANGRAYKLSYNRPFATRGATNGRDFLFSNEYPTIRFLEQNGYDVSYVSGLDVGTDPSLLPKHKVFLSVGHDEYWTAGQRNNVTNARDAGVNLAFLGGNDVYWKSRWEPSQDGTATPNRTLVTYKDTWTLDSGTGTLDKPDDPTPTWRDPRFGVLDYGYGPENALIGTQYQANSDDLAMQVTAEESKLRLWRNAKLTPGATTTLSDHTIGYESNEDVDNGFRPAGLIRMSTTTGPTPEYLTDYGSTVKAGTTTHHLTMYRAASGALVFSAGTIQWGWGLDPVHDGTPTAGDSRMRQATANVLSDMGAQPTTVASDLTLPSPSTDTTPPTVQITSPAAGSTIAQGSLVTVSGTATDVGGVVAGVEVSVDGGSSFHPASGTTSWSYTDVLAGNGSQAIQVRATDDSARTPGAPTYLAVNSPCPCTLFGVGTPTLSDAGDDGDVTLGTRFSAAHDGFITGIRFYKSDANTGLHTGTVYSASGGVLGSGTFTNETASGWQTLILSTAVPVSAGGTYVVAYRAPKGHYSADATYFRLPHVAGELTAAGGVGVPNGVFASGNAFPSSSYKQSNYWVDPVFSLTDTSPVSVRLLAPSSGATSVPTNRAVSATFSRKVDASSVVFHVTGPDNGAVPGAIAWDATGTTATFTPTQSLAPATTYTATVNVANLAAPVQWSFTTAQLDGQPNVCPCSVFNDDDHPASGPDPDARSVTLGMAFTTSTAGQISAVRFYKNPENTGTHTVALWSGSTKLGEATASDETASGWQEARLPTAVAVATGKTYVVSYTSPVGSYGFTSGGLSSGRSKSPLSTPANAGRYGYTSGAPTSSSSTNYFVDAVFSPAAGVAPVVRQITPADGARSVSVATHINVTFGSDVQAGSTQVNLKRTSDGTAVEGTTASEASASSATFTPASDLDPGTRYTVTVSGAKSPDGTPMSQPASSSFTTSGGSTCPCSLLESNGQPGQSDSGDGDAVTVGLRFTPTVDGYVKGLRYYRDALNTGTHTGDLWSATGDRLATLTFTDSGTGWQNASFSTAVPVKAGQTYVASYYAPNGHYSADVDYFANDLVNPPLRSVDPGGVYLYGNGFPNQTYLKTNYYVDVAFTTTDTDPPSVTAVTPADNATLVPAQTSVSGTFARDVDPASVDLQLKGADGQLVSGQTAYDTGARTATFTTAAPLAAGTTYSVNLSATSVSGVAMAAPKTWSFTTADADPPAVASTSPAASASGVAKTTKVAVVFVRQVDPASVVLALTTSEGSRAVSGSTTFDAATRTATFTPDTALADLTGYTASVAAKNVSGIAMTAPQTWTFTTSDSVAPSVSSTTPVSGATGVSSGTKVSVTFTNAVDPATVQLGLKTSSGVAITGATVYDAASKTATFSPGAALTSFTGYTATASAKNTSGVAMSAPTAWSFTTADTDPPSITSQSPASSATNVVASTNVTATFARAINSGTLAMSLKTSGGTTVPGSLSYSSTTRTATFNPTSDLISSTGYTVSVSATSASGVPMSAPKTWSFTTAAQTFSLYTTSRTPSATSTTTSPTTVGVRFSSSRAGKVTAIRYYAASTNTGSTVKLWGADGSVLGTATTTQTGTGWRTATFATPVTISTGTTYTASYYAPVGRVSTTSSAYVGSYTSGPLTVPAGGGVSSAGDTRPTTTSSTNYWVDVLVSI